MPLTGPGWGRGAEAALLLGWETVGPKRGGLCCLRESEWGATVTEAAEILTATCGDPKLGLPGRSQGFLRLRTLLSLPRRRPPSSQGAFPRGRRRRSVVFSGNARQARARAKRRRLGKQKEPRRRSLQGRASEAARQGGGSAASVSRRAAPLCQGGGGGGGGGGDWRQWRRGGGGGRKNGGSRAFETERETGPRSRSPPTEMSRQTATALPTGTSKCTPSQRVPALTGTTASNNDLASLFECPVCFDYVLPPILQCQSGHLVCSNCRPKLTCCPTCRGPLGSIRNLAMEKVANSVLFPCKYASSGCEITLPHTEKADHEELCEFRPYSCPCPGASCKWQGSLDAVMPHLMHQHKSITTLQGEDIVFLATDINLPGAVDWVMMQSCFGFHFMLVLEKQEKYDGHQQFFAIVQLIGTRKQAENFAYRLELNGHRRRLTWEATPRSIHEGIATAIMNSDCLVFDTSIAQLFAENGNLGINVTISMC
uniref:E3 ubiquitin-protein ligase n=1 Tax=Sarcophilus harrisii TaxID=9305 RepID=A0A7N4PQ01_SARHA